RRLALFGFANELVIDIGDVNDPADVKALVLQVSLNRIENDRAHHVPHVRRLVDGRPTQINPHLARLDRLKQLFLLRKRVVDPKTHGGESYAQPRDLLVTRVAKKSGDNQSAR